RRPPAGPGGGGGGVPRAVAARRRPVGVARRPARRHQPPLRRPGRGRRLPDRRRTRDRPVPRPLPVRHGPARADLGVERLPEGVNTDAHHLHGQRRAAAGRRRLGGREPALRPARPPRLPRVEERVRAGRVRVVHRLPRRGAGLLLPGGGRPGAGPRRAHRRGPGVRRRAVRDPAGVPRRGRGPVRLLHAGAAGRRARPHRAPGRAERRGDPRGARRQPVPLHRLRKDHGSGPAGRRPTGHRGLTMDTTRVLNGCAVVPVDGRPTEHPSAHVIVEGGRISAVAAGPAPDGLPGARYVDATGCLATPGLVNTHHHLYQWATRGLAVDSTLFGWLTELYPVWGRIDAAIVFAAARGGPAWLAPTRCT